MTIPTPNLDDRDFESLMTEARSLVASRGGAWHDLSSGDPGTIVIEAFAFLTDLLLYRLNRVPEKAYREFLRLLNVTIGPPAAARVELVFSLESSGSAPVEVPAGTRVQAEDASGSAPVVFITDAPVTVTSDAKIQRVSAHHCRQIEAELVGTSTGDPGQQFQLGSAPVVLATGHELDLAIGVHATAAELDKRPEARDHGGDAFVMWRDVESFATTEADERALMVDRAAGLVSFAPEVRRVATGGGVEQQASPLAAIPGAGREIRAWYRSGGGAAGNVAAATVTKILDSIDSSVTVTNPARATGGRDEETVEQAIVRARGVFHEPRRAIAADDFEALAVRHGGVTRARAITAAQRWVHAVDGTVDVHLVPSLPLGVTSPNAEQLDEMTDPATLDAVAAIIEARQPLGIRTRVDWARYKRVSVSLRAVVSRSEDPEAVRRRVVDRLRAALNPSPNGGDSGWPFGQALRISNIYDIALREPGVRYADSVVIEVDQTPDAAVSAIAADRHQPATWYAAQGPVLFRSENDGGGWEATWTFPGTSIQRVVPAPSRPGHLAVVVETDDGNGSQLFVSTDCGSTFPADPSVAFSWEGEDDSAINDVAWLPPGSGDDLVLATSGGLYRFHLDERSPRPWVVDLSRPNQGCWAVAVSTVNPGQVAVVAALMERAGVWLGDESGFAAKGMTDTDIRQLIVERRGNREFLWAPAFAVGDDEGTGCSRSELTANLASELRWDKLALGWNGGICHDLAFVDGQVLAASEFNGVLTRSDANPESPWKPPTVESGLPLQENRRFHRVSAVAALGEIAMVGTASGVYRTTDGRSFDAAASRQSSDMVTLAPSWLFASGEHTVTVVMEDR